MRRCKWGHSLRSDGTRSIERRSTEPEQKRSGLGPRPDREMRYSYQSGAMIELGCQSGSHAYSAAHFGDRRRRVSRLASLRAASRGRRRRPLRRQLFYRHPEEHRASPRPQAFRIDAARRDDEIYNLACPASPVHYQRDPVQTTKTSVHGAINMLGLAKRVKAKILQASTSEVYGDPHVHPQPEDYWGHVNPVGLRSCYDEGKRCAETLFFDYWRQHNSRIKVARIFNTYGPRMHPNDGRVVSNFITRALLGRDLTVYGDGTQTRSFCLSMI
jgi:nucleoside-diphosphate-sugar epimerase